MVAIIGCMQLRTSSTTPVFLCSLWDRIAYRKCLVTANWNTRPWRWELHKQIANTLRWIDLARRMHAFLQHARPRMPPLSLGILLWDFKNVSVEFGSVNINVWPSATPRSIWHKTLRVVTGDPWDERATRFRQHLLKVEPAQEEKRCPPPAVNEVKLHHFMGTL